MWRVTIGQTDGAKELTKDTMPEYEAATGSKRKKNAQYACKSLGKAKVRKT